MSVLVQYEIQKDPMTGEFWARVETPKGVGHCGGNTLDELDREVRDALYTLGYEDTDYHLQAIKSSICAGHGLSRNVEVVCVD
jgi:predicted RNase H-like HicB family nuclease